MFKATMAIKEVLSASDVKVYVQENEVYSEAEVNFPLMYSAPIQMRFISTDDDNDVAVRIDLMRVPGEKTDTVLQLINDFNNKYRYAKFILNDDNDVYAMYDMPVNSNRVGECAKEMVMRFVKIIREVHPQLLHEMLAQESNEEMSACFS